MTILAKTLLLSLSLGALSTASFAQDAPKDRKPEERQPGDRPDGPRRGEGRPDNRPMGPGGMGLLAPEKAKAAWELEASGVAARHKLSGEQTQAVMKAYTAARTKIQEKYDELRKARGTGDRPNPADAAKAVQDVEEAARADFIKAVADAKITGDTAAKINASLGSVGMTGRGWDVYVDAIAGFNLDAPKRQQALNAVEDFVVARNSAMESMRDDQQAARAVMDEAREKFTTTMKSVLSEEQFKTFETSTARGQGMRRPSGGPEGNPERRRDRSDAGGEGEPKPKGKK